MKNRGWSRKRVEMKEGRVYVEQTGRWQVGIKWEEREKVEGRGSKKRAI